MVLGCLVDNTNVNRVVFLGGAGPADNQAAIFQIRSATEIWTTVHAAAAYGFSCASTLALCVLDSCRCRPHVAGNSDGRRGTRGRPRNKVLIAAWLETELWVNPWLVGGGFVMLIASVVLVEIYGRRTRQKDHSSP